MVLLTVRVMCHLMALVTLLHMQPILMVPLALAEDLAWAKDLAWAEDLAGAEEWEEDGGKLNNWALGAVLGCLPGLLPCHRRVHYERRRTYSLRKRSLNAG